MKADDLTEYKVSRTRRHDEYRVLGPSCHGIRPLVARTIREETAEEIVASLNHRREDCLMERGIVMAK